MSLRDGVAVVTGASGAIGAAIARSLWSTGASVVLTGRSTERLQQTAKAIEKDMESVAGHGELTSIACDVTDDEAVARLFSDVERERGLCSLLVNCAGVMHVCSPEDVSAAALHGSFMVNVVGPALCAREAFKHMRRRPGGVGGRIINVGSLSAHSPRPNSLPYTISKFALNGLTQCLALDGREHNIGVGAVHPGNVFTDLLTPEQIAARRDTEGFITAADVAEVVLTMAALPPSANVLELTVTPVRQPFVGRG